MSTFKKLMIGAVFMIVAIYFVPLLAFAQDVATQEGNKVHIDLGEQVAWAFTALGTMVTGLIAAGMGLLPGPARTAIQVFQLDQVINRSIQSWISQNAAKYSKQAEWTVDLRNSAVAGITTMALNTGNKFVQGVRSTLADKIHARLEDYIRQHYA